MDDLDKSATVKQKGTKPPGIIEQAANGLLGVLAIHAIAWPMVLFLQFFLQPREIRVLDLHQTHWWLYLVLVLLILPLSVCVGILIGLRGVYLAQLVAVPTGVVAAIALLSELLYNGMPAPWYLWVIHVPVAGVIGFFSGLLVTGELKATEPDIEYKPIDAWDRSAQAAYIELDPPRGARFARLWMGFLLSLFLRVFLPWFIFAFFIEPAMGLNAAGAKALKADYELHLGCGALFFGAVLSASGTKSGGAQGFLTALAFYWTVEPWQEMNWLRLGIYLFVGVLGGVFGRNVFGPTKVYRGRKGTSSDPVLSGEEHTPLP